MTTKYFNKSIFFIFAALGFVNNVFSSIDLPMNMKIPKEFLESRPSALEQRLEDYKTLFTEVLLTTPHKYDIYEAISKIRIKYDPETGTVLYNPLSGFSKQVVSKPLAPTKEVLEANRKIREKREKAEELARSKRASAFHKFVKEKEMQNQEKKEREVKIKNEE